MYNETELKKMFKNMNKKDKAEAAAAGEVEEEIKDPEVDEEADVVEEPENWEYKGNDEGE